MTSSKKIAFITSSMGSGGAQRTIANLATGLAERNHTVDLLLLRKEGPYLEFLDESINIIEFNQDRFTMCVPELLSYYRNSDPDTVFSTMEHINSIIMLTSTLTNCGAKYVIRISTVRSMNKRSLKDNIQLRLAKIFYRYADELIALSHDVRDDASKFYEIPRERFHVIYNPIMVDRIQKLSNKYIELGRKDEENIILAVGRLSQEKNMEMAIRAFATVADDIDARLVILGEGPRRSDLEQLSIELEIDDQVSMPGFIENPFPYMREADVFVLPSKWEGFGHVIIEALACETPVVATNCPGGPSEILGGGKYGELVPVGDSDKLAEAICSTLKNPIPGDRLLKRAWDFDYKRIAAEYEQVII